MAAVEHGSLNSSEPIESRGRFNVRLSVGSAAPLAASCGAEGEGDGSGGAGGEADSSGAAVGGASAGGDGDGAGACEDEEVAVMSRVVMSRVFLDDDAALRFLDDDTAVVFLLLD